VGSGAADSDANGDEAPEQERLCSWMQELTTGLPATKVGAFAQKRYDEVKKQGWTIVSMKDDWKRIVAFEPLTCTAIALLATAGRNSATRLG
jgi:hypothetical protein